MKKTYVHISFLFFLITALSGVFMRAFPHFPNIGIPYENILHGHSHIAILGWAFLGVFVIFLITEWKEIGNKRHAMVICFALFLVSLCMFLAFLWQGYALFSIIFSTLHIFVEYWAALFIYKHMKHHQHIPRLSSLYYKGGMLALIISSIGPYALAVISANGWKEYAIFDMSVYFYLHFQYNGWLTLFLVGLFIAILSAKNILLKENLLKSGFWLYFISLFPGYFLSVLWVEDLNIIADILATIGSIGQWIGILLIILSFLPLTKIKQQFSQVAGIGTMITFLLLIIKSTSELGLIFPALADLVYDTRSVVIGYLHLTLLGFISIFILVQFSMIKILPLNKLSLVGFVVFFIGFAVNKILLFTDGLLQWIGMGTLPFHINGLLTASILLAVGIFIMWVSLFPEEA